MSAPLSSLKILDFSTLLPGPYATMILADLGAEVLRIEAPGRPDLVRMMPPFDADGNSSQHAMLNRSKKSLGLNLKKEGSADIVKKLISEQGYNIVVEQFRPGVMDRLGVGYESLKAVCPDLVFCSLTGYGQDGPLRDRAGHDINYLALSGVLSHYGRAGATPPPLPIQLADVAAGSNNMVIGLLAAVIRRSTTGEGSVVDISMHDGSVAWNNIAAANTLIGGERAMPAPESTMLNGGSFYDLYETADGKTLSVGSLEPKFWQGFCTAIGRDDLFKKGTDFRLENQQSFKHEVQAAIKTKTLAEWTTIFAEIDVCAEPVLNTAEALEHPHTVARNMLIGVPMANGESQQQVGTAIKLSNHEPEYKFTGTALGMHSKEVLGSLGFSESEIEDLYEKGVTAG